MNLSSLGEVFPNSVPALNTPCGEKSAEGEMRNCRRRQRRRPLRGNRNFTPVRYSLGTASRQAGRQAGRRGLPPTQRSRLSSTFTTQIFFPFSPAAHSQPQQSCFCISVDAVMSFLPFFSSSDLVVPPVCTRIHTNVH